MLYTFGESDWKQNRANDSWYMELEHAKADKLLSFSDMTFPHTLFRVMLCEQIYRGFMIDVCRHFFSVEEIKKMIESKGYRVVSVGSIKEAMDILGGEVRFSGPDGYVEHDEFYLPIDEAVKCGTGKINGEDVVIDYSDFKPILI